MPNARSRFTIFVIALAFALAGVCAAVAIMSVLALPTGVPLVQAFVFGVSAVVFLVFAILLRRATR